MGSKGRLTWSVRFAGSAGRVRRGAREMAWVWDIGARRSGSSDEVRGDPRDGMGWTLLVAGAGVMIDGLGGIRRYETMAPSSQDDFVLLSHLCQSSSFLCKERQTGVNVRSEIFYC